MIQDRSVIDRKLLLYKIWPTTIPWRDLY